MSKVSTVFEIVLIFLIFVEAGGRSLFPVGLISECIFRINLIAYDDTIITVAMVNVVGKVK